MANTIIQLKHSTVTGNVPASLANGEISINSRDGKLFYSTPLGVVTAFNPYPGPSGLDTELQFNDSGVVGSDADLTFNKTTNILSAKNIVVSGNNYFGNANLHEGITQLSVTNSGASSYLFDQYSGDNPSLYVGAGETLSFNLNVSGHPFLIRESSGGANTSAGLTHISSTGVVSSGADAQGKVSGVLFWKVPFSLIGRTYVYQCQIHGGMVGNIVIQQPASFVAANTTLAFNHADSAFNTANIIQTYVTSANANISLLQSYVDTANANITAAFAAANAATAIDITQNNSITAAFSRANNSLNVQSGGSVTGNLTITGNLTVLTTASIPSLNITSTITIGSGGVISGANTIYSNVFVANSGGYIEFSDGSKQYTANAGSGGGTTDQVARNTANASFIHANAAFNAANTGGGGGNSFGQIIANVGTILATSSNDSLQIVGESGISVSSNVSAKKVIVSVPAGFTFTTADYGFVIDSTNVIYDYGTI